MRIKKIIKYFIRTFLAFLGICLLASALIYLPPVQKWLTGKITAFVSEKYNIELQLGRISIIFPSDISLTDLVLFDQQHDTMLYAHHISCDLAIAPILRRNIHLKEVHLDNAGIHLLRLRPDLPLNIGVFSQNDTTTVTPTDSKKEWIITLGNVHINRSEFLMHDVASGVNIGIDIGEAIMHNAAVKLGSQQITSENFNMGNGHIQIKMATPLFSPNLVDTTTSKWFIDVGNMILDKSSFAMSSENGSLDFDVQIGHANLSSGIVDLGKSTVTAKTFQVTEGKFHQNILSQENKPQEPTVKPGQKQATSWLIEVEKIQLANSFFGMDAADKPSIAGFDPNHIQLANITASIDSFVNYGMVIKGGIKGLQLKHPSGFTIRNAGLQLALDSASTRVANMQLQTASSKIQLDVEVPVPWYQINDLIKQKNAISGQIDASIAVSDIYALASDSALFPFNGKMIRLESALSGTPEQIHLEKLLVGLPGMLDLSADGYIGFNTNNTKSKGTYTSNISRILKILPLIKTMDIRMDGKINDIHSLLAIEPDTTQSLIIPHNITLNAHLQAESDIFHITGDVGTRSGNMQLDGQLDAKQQAYRASLSADSLMLTEIFPKMNLGTFVANANADGSGFTMETLQANFEMQLDLLEYNDYPYQNINLEGKIDKGTLMANLQSDNEILKLQTHVEAKFLSLLDIQTNINIDLADLHKMGLMQNAFTLSTNVDAHISETSKNNIQAQATVSKTTLQTGRQVRYVEKVSAKAYSDSSHTNLQLVSGDMALDFDIFAGIDQINRSLTAIGVQLPKQIADGSFAFLTQPDTLPYFKLQLTAGRNNGITEFLQKDSIGFSSIKLGLLHNEQTLWSGNLAIKEFSLGTNQIDSINFQTAESNSRINYSMRVGNIHGRFRNFHRIVLDGYIVPHDVGAHLSIKTPSNQPFVDAAVQVALFDTAMTAHIVGNPIFGTEWQVNPQNFFTYAKKDGFLADVQLSRNDEKVSISNAKGKDVPKGAISLITEKINLGAITDYIAIAPPIAGILDANLVFALREDFQTLNGTANIGQLAYKKQTIGDIGLDAFYLFTKTEHRVSGDINVNGQKKIWVNGSFSPRNADSLMFEAGINALDLSILEAFTTNIIGNTQGTLDVDLSVTGSVKKPDINGNLKLNQASIKVIPTNMIYTLGSQTVEINHGLMRFDQFALTDPSGKALQINGTLNFTNLSAIMADINISASGLQLANVPKTSDGFFYGTTFADIDASLKGGFAQPVIRGKIGILDNTRLTYIPRQTLEVKNRKNSDIVRFRLPAADSIFHASLQENISDIQKIDLSVEINISESAMFVIGLSEDLSNYVAVQGGGRLMYTLNPEGYQNMMGKYEIRTGKVSYHPPAISEKIFDVEKGSYLNWTGDLMNPELNITAVQRVRISVTEEKSSRMVAFDIYVLLRNTLTNLDIALNLKSADGTIQSQLSTATPEEIAMQAMNILIYNTYTAPGSISGNTGGGNLAMDALNGLISKELNLWAQNHIKGANLTFNVESYTQYDESGQEVQQTDFAYQFSKKILNNRGTIRIGGHMGMTDNPEQSAANSLMDDIIFEYTLDKRERKYLKTFRQED